MGAFRGLDIRSGDGAVSIFPVLFLTKGRFMNQASSHTNGTTYGGILRVRHSFG